MKQNRKSFGVRLWLYFTLFAVVILMTLWILQTVFLQSFYNSMVIKNVKEVASQIVEQQNDSTLSDMLDTIAYENSLLIFITNEDGGIIYGTDEHSHVYTRNGQHVLSGANPYHSENDVMNWQVGTNRNLSLPADFDTFIDKLTHSESGEIGYKIDDGAIYVYGRVLNTNDSSKILYISTSLDAVGATVTIIRTQLIWVMVASIILASILAYFIARKFSRPVQALSSQAKHMAERGFDGNFEKGFCSELDELADTLTQTADEISKTESFRREFLANVSHDLRTPLTMIRGYAEMVRDFSWEDTEQREKDLSIIIREANRLTNLVNDILDYTGMQSNVIPLADEAFDLSVTAQEVLEQFEILCQHNGFIIETNIEPGLIVHGERQQIARVLYNLIDNAVSHAGEERRVEVVLSDINGVVRTEIRDFGEGISEENLPYVWERYFTLKQQKRNAKSSGLGLAISKEILLAHQAKFGADSKEGQGSVFWFELPKVTENGKDRKD